MNQYNLTMTGEQLTVMNTALEWFFRLQMGQFFDYATEIAHDGYEYDKSNPDNDRLFYEYIDRRNTSQEMFERAFRVAQPKLCYNPVRKGFQSDVENNRREYCPKCHKRVYAREGLICNQPPKEE